MKLYDKLIAISFSLIILTMLSVLIFSSDRVFSQNENRYLKQLPKFNLSDLIKGKYTQDLEAYISDQTPFRDKWITLLSRLEIMIGKKEINGVLIGKDGYLIQKPAKLDMGKINKNIECVNRFLEKSKIPIYSMIIPTVNMLYPDKLPNFSQYYTQNNILDYINGKLNKNINKVDVLSDLSKHKNDYIFYKTDHHWTSFGAYIGYYSFMQSLGLKPKDLKDFNKINLTNSFLGSMDSKTGIGSNKDTITAYYPKNKVKYTVKIHDDGRVLSNLYDKNYLSQKDKYSVFFGGNHGLMEISTNAANNKNLLIIKDSYANSLIPFLINDFKKIYVVDLRYYKMNLSDYAKSNKINNTLILYNVSNFTTDPDLIWLN